jgi:hypothetical protein
MENGASTFLALLEMSLLYPIYSSQIVASMRLVAIYCKKLANSNLTFPYKN